MDLPVDYTILSRAQRKKVREEYVRLQEGRCSHCGEALDGPASFEVMEKQINLKIFPKGFLNYPVHLHHCHDTGMTIGAVHCYCNAVLFQYYGK